MAAPLIMIDNYDSFTYNLVQYLWELGAEMEVHRNDKITCAEIARRRPRGIVLSPGPSTPDRAGISLEVIRTFLGKVPLLGVCLGHQALGQACGGRIVRAAQPMHGKTSPIHHDGWDLFKGLPDPFEATRYHSLLVEKSSLPGSLQISAWTAEGEIMGLRHREAPAWGVQFHPESILTREGKALLSNFLALTG